MMEKLPQWIDERVIAWGQYLHWADINFNRHLCSDEDVPTSIALAFQWFASEYVVIEGWEEINHHESSIASLLEANTEGIDLLRRARNAVFHFQKAPLDKRLLNFATAYGASGWLNDLHQAFLNYLLVYPSSVYPHSERKEEFAAKFFDAVGWHPEPLRK